LIASRSLFVLLAAALLAVGARGASAGAQESPDSRPAPSASASPHAGASGAPLPLPSGGAAPGGFGGLGSPQSYTAFTKTAERQSGLIDVLKKDDDDLTSISDPEQFDRPFIVAPVLASGVG
jgi:hypothetical protein